MVQLPASSFLILKAAVKNVSFYNWFTVQLQRRKIITTQNVSQSDQNDVITNVPAIISTSASPTDIVPPKSMVNLVTPLAPKRLSRHTHKTGAGEPLSFENDMKMGRAPNVNHPPSQQYSHTKSNDLAYCTKCGGLTTYDKGNLSKKRYFSLDKERNERTTNFLQCITMNQTDTIRSVSENLLSNNQKQSSFDGGTSEKSFGRLSNSNANTAKTKDTNDCMNQNKNTASSKMKKENTHRPVGCTTSCSNRSFRDKSNKSSQNSLRDQRTSRKSSMFLFGSSERDASTSKSKKGSQQFRKPSTRGTINLHEEQDAETREILLGSSITTHSKFDKIHEIKIPEPVEAVRSLFAR